MTSGSHPLRVVVGDLFESPAQTLVNTVNTVGVMGKGVALGFRRRFPEMYEDYIARCEHGEVRLGRPYLWRGLFPPFVLNFPTKEHWRSVSRLRDIVDGLEYLEQHYREWGIESLAVPPLGCGQGGLDWAVVGPTLYRQLARLDIPVDLFAPYNTPASELEAIATAGSASEHGVPDQPRIKAGWVALVGVLDSLYSDPHNPPVGKTSFQKVAYFATVAGIPTGLAFERGTYGPYAAGLSEIVSRLVNNELIRQVQLGRMLAYKLGETYSTAADSNADELASWREPMDRVVDLFARFKRTRDAEIAATAHFAAMQIGDGVETVDEDDVLRYVMEWKQRKQPPLREDEVLLAMRNLAMLGWLNLKPSTKLEADEEALVGLGQVG